MDSSHLFWQGIDPIAANEDRVGGACGSGSSRGEQRVVLDDDHVTAASDIPDGEQMN
jgi:hypothetical protein